MEADRLTLWAFSLRLYSVPGVPDACLELQDRHGVDINMLMHALWAGYVHGVELSSVDLASADHQIQAWRAIVVRPLRAVRRDLKHSAQAQEVAVSSEFRQKVQRLELEAERLQQECLERTLVSSRAPGVASLGLALKNLETLLPEMEGLCGYLDRMGKALVSMGAPAP